jgi:hypothetical protein
MTSRNIRSRIDRLEKSRKPTDGLLVVWRLPDGDISEALGDVSYAPGDRVVCLEWYGEGSPPAPKWRKDLSSLSKEEDDSFETMLKRELDACRGREEVVEAERRSSGSRLRGYSYENLCYMLFGVPDGMMIRKL